MQLKRDLGVSYKTAWYLYHRIREIMAEGQIPKLGGIVEIDETYVGCKRHGRKYQGRRDHKICVVGMKERGGKLRLFHAPDAKIETLAAYIKEHVSADVEAIMTDELPAYPKALRISGHDEIIHKTVNHTAENAPTKM